MKIIIDLNKIEKVKEFVQAAQECDSDVFVSSLDGKYRVNGKSILGIFSLDLSKPIVVEGRDISAIEKCIQPYRCAQVVEVV